jgi:hypothetical protein
MFQDHQMDDVFMCHNRVCQDEWADIHIYVDIVSERKKELDDVHDDEARKKRALK